MRNRPLGCEGGELWATNISLRSPCVIGAILVCLCWVSAYPQQSAQSVDYARTVWKVADGLPENTITALSETTDGSLWIGTTGGLAKTGGGRIRTPLQTPSITCIAFVADRTLWMGTDGAGLLHLTGRIPRIYSVSDGLSNGFVRSIFQDRDGQIWIGTDRGLFIRKGERFEQVRHGGELISFQVRSITQSRDGRIWIAGAQLISIEEDRSRVNNFPRPTELGFIETMLESGDGTLWLGADRSLAKISHGQIQEAVRFRSAVRALLERADHSLWIGTEGDGLWIYRDGSAKRLDSAGLLPSETIISLLEDEFGQIWIGTRGGLVRLEHSPLNLVSLPGRVDQVPQTIAEDDDGTIWVAAQKVYVLQRHVGRQIDLVSADPDFRSVAHGRDGSVWLGSEGRGVFRWLHGSLTLYSAPAQLPGNSVRVITEGADGALWIGTEGGVAAISSTGVLKLRESDGLAYSSVRTILEDHSGSIWIGTDNGASLWQNGHFTSNPVTGSLRQEKIWSILEDRQHAIWFGTREHGLFRFKDGKVSHFSTECGLPSNSVYKMLQDSNGTFWISGPNVIFSLQESELEQNPSSSSPLNPVLYAIPSEGVEMDGGQEPSGLVARDGSVWFPSNRGLVNIDVAHVPSNKWTPKIWGMDDAGFMEPVPESQHLSAGAQRLTYRLMAVYLRPQSALRFRYKMDGVDSNWTQIRPDESITYTSLRPGHFQLRLQAIDFATAGALSEKIVDIYKSSAFYETWWFYATCVGLCALLVWAVYSYRVRQVRSRFDAVLAERTRLAREMHDTVIQGCAGMSVLVEAIQNADSNPDERRQLLAYARELATSTVNQARQAIWVVRHSPESKVDLTKELREIAEQLHREHDSISLSLDLEEAIILPSSVAHEVIMTVRESAYNALRHSGTDRLLLRTRFDEQDLIVEVTDYGSGIASENVQEGQYGIRGMRERAKRIGARIEIFSSHGKGTRVTISLARARALVSIETGQ